MSKDFEQDIINIDLENLSSSDSVIDLFSYESNNINSIAQTVYTSIITNIGGVGVSVTVSYKENGVTNSENLGVQTDNDDFITNANIFFDGIFSFSYEYYSETESKMLVTLLNNNYTLTSLLYSFF